MQLPVLRRQRTAAKASYRSRALYAAAWTAGHSVFRVVPLNPRTMAHLGRLDVLASRAPAPRYASVEPVSFDGFEAEWVRARGATDEGTVLYFHGGGFFFGGLNTHRRGVARISANSSLPVLSVAYRQLPTTPIAGSIADCITAYQHLLDSGVPADKIVFAGDSAGGYLAFATAMRARELGLPIPAGIVAASPLLDIDSSARMQHPNVRREAYIPVNRFPALTELWTGDPERHEPPVSPINEDPTGLPPSLIMAAESEILRLDAETMAHRLWDAGVACKLQIWERQVHAFPVLGHLTPETKAALVQIGRFVREVTKLD